VRADRLLSILLLLQTNRRMTARAIADRLEVSERTVHRDMEALCMAGVPVYAQRGNGGGWLLPDSYRTKVTGLTTPEVQALVLGRPARILKDLGLGDASDAALVKLLAELPAGTRHDAEYARQRLHIDSAGWRRAEESIALLPAVQAAVWQERRVTIAYQRSVDEVVERTVDPLGLVAKGSLWYLVAAVGGDVRTYRVSRIRSVTVLDERSIRPSDFDLATFWEQSSAQFVANLPRYPLVVRVAPDARRRAATGGGYVRVESVEMPDVDGWTTMRLQADTEMEARGFVLSFGAQMEVREPPDLRERLRDLAAGVVALYTDPDG
jgi:predicted DNA-binding transcriptional regulator YafY